MKKSEKSYLRNDIKMLKYLDSHEMKDCKSQVIKDMFGAELVDSASSYNYISSNNMDSYTITVIGRDKLQTHRANTRNMVIGIATLIASLISIVRSFF